MAAIGMKNIYFNKIQSEAENALPTYVAADGRKIGALVSANLTLNYVDAEAYADDKQEDEIHEFLNGLLETEVFEIDGETSALLFGSSYTDGALTEGGNDTAAMGGLAYAKTIRKRDAQGIMKTMWKGYFYPKVQARRPTSESGTTKQGSVSYAYDGASFRIFESNTGAFREIQEFATAAEYDTWAKGKLNIT